MADGTSGFNALPLVIGLVGGLVVLIGLYFCARKVRAFLFQDDEAKPRDIQFVDVTSSSTTSK